MIRYSTRWGRHSRVSMPGWLALCVGLVAFSIDMYIWFAKIIIMVTVFGVRMSVKACQSVSRHLRERAAREADARLWTAGR